MTINKIFVLIFSSTYAPDSSVTLGGNPRADSTKQHPGRACKGRRRAWKRTVRTLFCLSIRFSSSNVFCFVFIIIFFARFHKCLICFPCVCRACRVLWVSFHTKTASRKKFSRSNKRDSNVGNKRGEIWMQKKKGRTVSLRAVCLWLRES